MLHTVFVIIFVQYKHYHHSHTAKATSLMNGFMTIILTPQMKMKFVHIQRKRKRTLEIAIMG